MKRFKHYREKQSRIRQKRIDEEREQQIESAVEIIDQACGGNWTVEEQVEPAIQTLGISDQENSIYWLLSLATSEHSDARIKYLAIEALTRQKSQQKINNLKKELASSSSDTRLIAADILYQLGETKWKGIIKGDNTDYVSLANTDDPIFIGPLASTACFLDVPWAKKALEEKTGNRQVLESLHGYLGSYDKARLNAVLILAKLGEPQWKEVIKGDDDDIRRIMKSDDPGFIGLLPSFLYRAHGSGEIIRKIEGLDRIKDPIVIGTLIRLLDHQDTSIRFAAARTLIKISKEDFSLIGSQWKEASKLITEPHEIINEHLDTPRGLSDCHGDSMKHTDTGIGLELPLELQETPVKKVIVVNPLKQYRLKRLIGVLKNRQELTGRPVDIEEKYKIVLKLGKLGNAQAVESLVDTLQGNVEMLPDHSREGYMNYDLKSLAATVLGDLGDLSAAGPLARALLQDEYAEVRCEAAIAIGKLGTALAFESLTFAMSDWDGGVRMEASNALWKLGESRWENVIQGDDSDFGRLAGLEDAGGIGSLLRALKDETRHDRNLLIEALVDVISNPAGIVRKQMKESVLFALENLPVHEREQVVEELIKSLENPSGYVREQASKSLIYFVSQDFSLIRGKWKNIADQISKPHEDRIDTKEMRKYSEYSMQYYNEKEQIHTDTGIGLEIPPELKI